MLKDVHKYKNKQYFIYIYIITLFIFLIWTKSITFFRVIYSLRILIVKLYIQKFYKN
jgi:hypothetical protein